MWLYHIHHHGCGGNDNSNEDHHTRDRGDDDARGNDNVGHGIHHVRGGDGVQELRSSEVQGFLQHQILLFESM